MGDRPQADPFDDGPVVGIVIAAYNAAPFLGETLASIRRQTHRRWTCVVVDDGSTDSTPEIATAVAAGDDRFTVHSVPNGGPCLARNAGYALLPAGVDLITFMDADDVWTDDALDTLVCAAQTPGRIGAHGLGEFIDAEGHELLPGVFSSLGRSRQGCGRGWPVAWPSSAPTCFETVATTSVIFPPGLILVRRAVYEDVGLFDPTMRYAEDWDLLIRACRAGDLQFVDRVILGYRRHDTNTGAGSAVAEACQRVRVKTLTSSDNTHAQRRVAMSAWRAAQVLDARDRLRTISVSLRTHRLRDAAQAFVRLPVLGLRYLLARPIPGLDTR